MEETFVDPFAHYPHLGRQRLGRIGTTSAKPEYGLRLYQRTHWKWCGFCHRDLVENFELWRNLQVDHAIPASVAKKLGIGEQLYEDAFNRVLICPACNTFCNQYRYSPPTDWVLPQTDEEFAALRDAIFRERWELVRAANAADEKIWRLWQAAIVD